MDKTRLEKVLELHKLWLDNKEGGCRADLIFANLSRADLRDADLSRADLRGANLSRADLRDADLIFADLRDADLIFADLSRADLRGANLSRANLSDANLSDADLSGAEGLLSSIAYIDAHFKRTDKGYIAYKTFNSQYKAPRSWTVEPDSVITENVNPNRTTTCGCGINVAPLEWVRRRCGSEEVWKVLIEWPWLAGVVVPYGTDGKIRCEKVRLLEVVK